MKLPSGNKKSDRAKKLVFVEDLKDRCLVSRIDRRQQYSSNRLYWLYGSDGSYSNEDDETGLGPPPGNKIYPYIDQLESFIYSPDTTRFSVEQGVSVPDDLKKWAPDLNQLVYDEWHNSNTDIIFGLALTYSLVYGSAFVKPIWRKNGIHPSIILPHNVGVLREDIPMLSRQEAFVHCYTITPSNLDNMLAACQHPRRAEIMKSIVPRGEVMVEETSGIDRIVMSAQDPLGTGGQGGAGSGNIDWMAIMTQMYQPRVREQLVEMYELYVFDDELEDFRIITVADPFVPIFDRPLKVTGGLPHEEPFIQICPNPMPDYFWGISEVERVTPLQTWRNQCMAQIEHLLELEAHPPSTSVGFPGDLLENQYAMDTPSGYLNQPDPAQAGGHVKAERLKIDLPATLWDRVDRIDQMFEDMGGMTNVMSGKGESGVRSQGHASQLARLGASRVKKRALIIEKPISTIATNYLKTLQKYDDTRLKADDGTPFIAEQYTDDFVVKVDAHSSSAIFIEDQEQRAYTLYKLKVITRERLLDLVEVPMRGLLKNDLKTIIEPAEKAAAAKQEKLQQEMIAARQGGKPKGAPSVKAA